MADRNKLGQFIKGNHYGLKTEFKKGDIRTKGKNSSGWKGGKPNCLDCGKKIGYYTKRCRNCAAKLRVLQGGLGWSFGVKHRGLPVSIEEKKRLKKIGIQATLKLQNMKEPTSIEKRVYEELKSRGLLFETQKLINNKFVVDAYIPSLNLVIEADGDYWHSLDRVKKRDKAKNAYLTKCGFNMLRLNETEIKNGLFINKLEEKLYA